MAGQAGVSTATVSYVLNGRFSEVSDDTRLRVWAAVEATGYAPNALARSLAGRPTHSLGLLWLERQPPGGLDLTGFLAGLGDAILPAGYALLLAGAVAPVDLPPRVGELLARQVEGLILLGLGPTEAILLDEPLARAARPAVLCGAAPEGFPAAQVGVDQREGMRLAASHLLDLGHRHLAYLDSAPDLWPYGLRRQGVEAALDALGRSPAVLFATTDGSEAGGYQTAERLFGEVRHPTAFLCANDAIAVGVLRAAWRRGVQVPEQVAVVGFGDHPVAAYTVPTLTTVRGSLQAVGALAGRLLCEAIAAGEQPCGVHHLSPKVVVRESCGSHLWL